MGKKKVKMIIPDLNTLDIVAAIKREHPEWGSREIGHYLKDERHISLSSKDLELILGECMSIATKNRYSMPAVVAVSQGVDASRNKMSMPYWGWFSW